MESKKEKVCIECKKYPVRQPTRDLCYACFQKGLQDLFRKEDEAYATNRVNQTS